MEEKWGSSPCTAPVESEPRASPGKEHVQGKACAVSDVKLATWRLELSALPAASTQLP